MPGPWLPPCQRPAIAPVVGSAKDARPVHDGGLLGRGERHLDDVDAEERRVRVLLGILRPSSPASSSADRTALVPDP